MDPHHDRDSLPCWLLDEIVSAGRENLDPVHVAAYDAKEDADAAAELRLCRDLGLTADSVVVEFGPGTGQFTSLVAAACAQVIAVDVSPVMLDALRSKIKNGGLDNVEPVQAGFLSYEHHGPPVDLVYSRYALHHLPDFFKVLALERIHGLLRPGGLFRLSDVVFSFEPRETVDRIESWCASVPTDDADPDSWNRADLEEHVRDEYSTFSWLLEPMFLHTGFAVEAADYSDDGIFARYSLRRT